MTEKKQETTAQSMELASGWTDTLKTIIADILDHEKTRTGTKSLAQTIADRFVRYAGSTPNKIDDLFAKKVKTEVDEHFSEWYEYFLGLVGLAPSGEYYFGEPVYGLGVAPDADEIERYLDRPSAFLGQASTRFGVSVNTIKEFIRLLVPIVIEWYLGRKATLSDGKM